MIFSLAVLIFLYDIISWDVNVTPSTLKVFMKFWGTCFKFWLRPWRRERPFLERKSIDLSSKLSLPYGVMLTILMFYSACGNREYSGGFQNKSVSSSFKWVSKYILSLAKLKERRRPFLEGARMGGIRPMPQEHLRITREYLAVTRDEKSLSLFKKFEIISPLLCYLLDPLKNNYNRAWSSMINFVDRFQDLSKGSCCYQEEGLIITCSFKEKMFWGIWCCHTDHALLGSFLWYGSIKL